MLGAGKRVSFAKHLKKSAKSKNLEICLYSYELTKEVPIDLVSEIIIGLKWNDSNLIKDLSAIIQKKDIQMILAFVDPAVEILPILKHLFPNIYIPCCSSEISQIMFDKKLATLWFKEHSIPIPKTHTCADPFSFPLIAKPRKGSASQGLIIINSSPDLENFYNNFDKDKYLIQEYIANGIEYTVDAFVSQKKEIISIVPRIRLEQAGGESIRSQTVHNIEIETLSKNILQNGDFIGPITLQFIENPKTHNLFLMEINPRYGGAVITSFAAGADTTLCLIDECFSRPLKKLDWKKNILMTRYFKEVIFYADNY